jgi:hypothetical protein
MPKRRSKQKAAARKRVKPSPKGTTQTNLRRFTTSAWAICARVLERRRDLSAILDLMGFFDWLGDQNLARIVHALPPLPCRSGCAYCCYVGTDRPDLLAPEALRIAAFLREEGSRALPLVLERLAQAEGSPGHDPKTPCLFLHQERCLVYAVRPMRCRAQHSPDRDACRQSYLGTRETMPLLREPALLFKSIQTGMRLALRELGVQHTNLALTGAVRIALGEPGSLERWMSGQAVFAEYPDDTGEEHALDRLARQAKRQLQSEARALQRVLSLLTEQPGAWAAYTTSGTMPALDRASRGETFPGHNRKRES